MISNGGRSDPGYNSQASEDALTREQLKDWRLKRNLTQAEAAKAVGVSQEMWSMLEDGDRPLPEGFEPKLAEPSKSSKRRGPYRTTRKGG